MVFGTGTGRLLPEGKLIKDLYEKYAALGKTFTIQAIITENIYTTLKAKDKSEILVLNDDYFKSNAGENKRSADETYKAIIITVAEGVKKDIKKNKKTFKKP